MVEGAALKIRFFRYSPAQKLNMEAYRSGHNGPDSKSGSLHGLVGSNPTASAIKNTIVFLNLEGFEIHGVFVILQKKLMRKCLCYSPSVITENMKNCSTTN